MSCELTLSGQLVVGGGCGCGGSSGSGGGGQTIQPLSLGCGGKSYDSIQSSDCATRISTDANTWVPLPIGPINSVEFLSVQTKGKLDMRWGGAAPLLTGGALSGAAVTFVGTETFTFTGQSPAGVPYTATTSLTGTLTMAAIVAAINGAAVTAGAGYMPASLNKDGTVISIKGGARGAAQSLEVVAALASIGFPVPTLVSGTDPTQVGFNGLFLSTFDPAVTGGFEVKGVADVIVMAAGS